MLWFVLGMRVGLMADFIACGQYACALFGTRIVGSDLTAEKLNSLFSNLVLRQSCK